MLAKLQTLVSLSRTMGLRWLVFRLAYDFRSRSGLLRKQMPQYSWSDRPLGTWLKSDVPVEPNAYLRWRKENSPKFFFETPIRWTSSSAVDEADGILSGRIRFFSHEFQQTCFPPDWLRDPISNVRMDAAKHWSQISSEGGEDIKFIWEASRFSFAYTLARAYASTQDERYAEAFWQAVESWAESNPPNSGPNWMDGQEAALRIMVWTFAMHAFAHSPSSTPQRICMLTVLVAAHAERIHQNTDFALFTRGNHAITEALGLWLAGMLFPELKEAEKYLSEGRALLEQEGRRQIFDDGTYSMYSLNYHRFVLHVYLYALRLAEINLMPFSDHLRGLVAKSVAYLSELIDPRTGQVPFYGSNDGALILPLNNCDYLDFRPLLQLGSVITAGRRMFVAGDWDEDAHWLCGYEMAGLVLAARSTSAQAAFPDGGIYLLRGADSKVVIRCTEFRERPSHADQLHLDVWIHGQNIACDAGTYLYGGKGVWRNGLAHTDVHNTVIVDNADQMKKFSRFIWVDWSKGTVLRLTDTVWQGEHKSRQPVQHKRTVFYLGDDRWLVVDDLDSYQPHLYTLHWLLNDAPYTTNKNSLHLKYGASTYKIQIGLMNDEGEFSVVRADPNSTRGWRSRYYAQKEPAVSVKLETRQASARFWTFFGFELDEVKMDGNVFTLNSQSWTMDN